MKRFIVILLVVVGAVCQVQSAGSFHRNYFKSVYDGDYKEQANIISNLINSNPESPYSAVYADLLSGMDHIAGYKSVNTVIEKYIENISSSNMQNKNEALLNAYFVKESLDFGYMQAKTPLYQKYSMIKKWNVSTRFRKYGKYDLNNSFSPEKSGYKYPKTITTEDSSGFVYPYEFVYPENGIYYFNADIKSSNSINLIIETYNEYKVFVNGKEVLVNSGADVYRNRRILQLEGAARYSLTIKMRLSDGSSFRVVTTASDYSAIEPSYSISNSGGKSVKSEELMFYPYNSLIEDKSPESNAALANYFYSLNSTEFRKYYQILNEEENDDIYTALEAKALISIYSKNSPYGSMAWKNMANLWRKDKEFVPAQYYKFQTALSNGNTTEALKIAEHIRGINPEFYDLEIDLLNFYFENSFDSLFLQQAERVTRLFPNSYLVDLYYVQYYSIRDVDKSQKYAEKILSRINSKSIIKRLINVYIDAEEYDKASSLIDKYDVFISYDKKIYKAEINIAAGEYKKAREILMQLMVQNETPVVLFYLGLLSQKETGDTDPYWKKLEKYYPEYNFPTRYNHYRATGRIESEFEKYRDKKFVDSELKKFVKDKKYMPKAVAYRSNLIKIYKNRKMRFFQEELLFMRTSGDVDATGEYRIPANRNYQLLRARVYKRDGSYSDSYRINRSPNGSYITINGVAKDTLIHIIYEISDLNSNYYGSELTNSGLMRLQFFGETIGKASVKLISPFKDIVLYNNKNIPMKTESSNGENIVSFTVNNVARVDKESSSGDGRRNLISFGYSNIVSVADFVKWYRGSFPANNAVDFDKYIKIDSELSKTEKITKIYNYVAREIEIQGGIYYSPSEPESVMHSKKGSVEDKAFLAVRLLKENGIEAYPALVRDNYIYSTKINFNNIYDNIVVYIPSEKMWLDFYSEYFPCGIVNDYNSGQQAVIIKDNSLDQGTVSTKSESSIKTECNIEILDGGISSYDVVMSAIGNKNYLRRYFIDKRKHSLFASAFLTMFQGKFIPDSYNISDIYDYGQNLNLASTGKIYGFYIEGKDSLSFSPMLRTAGFIGYIRENKRTQDILITSNEFSEDVYTIKVSEKYIQSEVYLGKKFTYKDAYVEYRINKKKGENVVNVKRIIHFPKRIITPKEYEAFYRFCVQVYQTDNYRVVLKVK